MPWNLPMYQIPGNKPIAVSEITTNSTMAYPDCDERITGAFTGFASFGSR